MINEPPPLQEQLEEFIILTLNLSKEYSDMDFLADPPRCENKIGKAKYEAWEDPNIPKLGGSLVRGNQGDILSNMNYCPHCNHLIIANPPIGSTVSCWNCGGHFTWSA